MMRVAIACDHVGFSLKASIIEALEQDEHAVLDLGTHGSEPIDYPPMAKSVATAVGKGFVEMGILLSQSGMGATIAANRFSGIRAVASADVASARESRAQLNANFLCVGAAGLAPAAAVALVKEWVGTQYAGDENAGRMLSKIGELTGASATRGVSSAAPRPSGRESAPAASPAPAPAPAPAAYEAPPPPPPAPVEVPKAPDITAVMKVVASVREPDTKIIATRILQFLRNRFPTAAGAPTEEGFQFSLDGQHVATVTIGKNFVELEAGPDRITTSKIRDAERLDLLLNLPSITKAFDAIKM
jgi:ribose 5-phosphate isomerase B